VKHTAYRSEEAGGFVWVYWARRSSAVRAPAWAPLAAPRASAS
jgi:hypothetical protein